MKIIYVVMGFDYDATVCVCAFDDKTKAEECKARMESHRLLMPKYKSITGFVKNPLDNPPIQSYTEYTKAFNEWKSKSDFPDCADYAGFEIKEVEYREGA